MGVTNLVNSYGLVEISAKHFFWGTERFCMMKLWVFTNLMMVMGSKGVFSGEIMDSNSACLLMN